MLVVCMILSNGYPDVTSLSVRERYWRRMSGLVSVLRAGHSFASHARDIRHTCRWFQSRLCNILWRVFEPKTKNIGQLLSKARELNNDAT